MCLQSVEFYIIRAIQSYSIRVNFWKKFWNDEPTPLDY